MNGGDGRSAPAALEEKLEGLSPDEKKRLLARLLAAQQRGAKVVPSAEVKSAPLPGSEAPADAPLTPAQERLWFFEQLDPGQTVFHLPGAFRLRGDLRSGALLQAFETVWERHEVVRSRIVDGPEGPRQIPVPWPSASSPPALPVIDLGALPAARGEAVAAQLRRTAVERPFDFEGGALLRSLLLRHRPDSDGGGVHDLVVVLHHIAGDGWSQGVLVEELRRLYASSVASADGVPEPLPELPVQYGDYAQWLRDALDGEGLRRQLDRWREMLGGAPFVLELPTDRPRPPLESHRGAVRSLQLDPELQHRVAPRLEALAQRTGSTLFMVLFAAYSTLLGRLSGQRDLLVGTPVGGRLRPELEQLVGFFSNVLVLRASLGAPTFLDVLAALREHSLEAFEHQQLPFEELVQALQPERLQDRHPIFQTLFVFHNTPRPQLDLPGLTVEPLVGTTGATRVDLTLELHLTENVLWGSVEYAVDLFDDTTVERWIAHLGTLLEAVADDPRRPLTALPWLSAAQRHQLCWEWGQGARATESPAFETPEAWVFAGLAANPGRRAVLQGDEAWTAGELARRARRLARALRAVGVGRGGPSSSDGSSASPRDLRVGLYLERSPRLLLAVLAVLDAGGTYVPLDPDHPQRRLSLVVEDAQLGWVLEESYRPATFVESTLKSVEGAEDPGTRPQRLDLEELMASVPEAGDAVAVDGTPATASLGPFAPPPESPPWPSTSPERAAYVLHTSGSTGRPKGVVVSRRSVCAFLAGMAEAPGFDAGDIWFSITTLAFDISVLELLLPLARGGTVAIATAAETQDGELLGERLRAYGATTLQGTPVTWRLLLEAGAPLGSLRRALCGGEAMPPALARQLLETSDAENLELWNVYGPTETTVWSSRERVRREDVVDAGGETFATAVSVGRACGGDRLWILGPDATRASPSLAPIGVAGELWIGGPGVAQGYDGQPARTAQGFVPDPWSPELGARAYRTGDRARYRADGRLDFLGRFDHQLKVRGVRMEAGEIEAALEAHEGVERAVVGAVAPPGDRYGHRLVAWVLPRDLASPPSVEALREHGAGHLTTNMVPTVFVFLEELPLTPSRKVDRRRLPDPPLTSSATGAVEGDGAEPATALEELVVGVFSESLGQSDSVSLGVNTSFFDLGGHSLLAHRAMVRLRETLELPDLAIGLLFEAPTARQLAARLERALESGGAGGAEGTLKPVPLLALPRAAEGEETFFPLSFSQLRQWFLDQLEPGTPDYNLPVAVDLEGTLDRAALDAALGSVARRHEILRTRFVPPSPGYDEPRQGVAPTPTDFVHHVDLTALPAPLRETAALDLAQGCATTSFDLSRLPLARALVLRLRDGADEAQLAEAPAEEPPTEEILAGESSLHRLLLTLHHIIVDGWSFDVVLRETAAFYQARVSGAEAEAEAEADLEPLAVQYGDYAAWQRERLAGERLDRQLGHWREVLGDGGSPPLELPTDRPRPALQSFTGGSLSLELNRAATDGLTAIGRRLGATLYMVLLATVDALLYRLTGHADLSVGTYVAGRSRQALEPLVGFFVNTLTLRARFAPNAPFDAVLAAVRRASLGALAHQDVPFEQLLEELAPPRDLSRTPFFQALLVLQNAPLSTLQLPALTLRPAAGGSIDRANFDLTLWARERPEGLVVDLSYNRDLFDESSIARFLEAWNELLAAVVVNPLERLSQLPLMPVAQRRQVVETWSAGLALRAPGTPAPEAPGTSSSLPPASISVPLDPAPVHLGFGERAAAAPEAVAVAMAPDDAGFAPPPVSYGQLARAAAALARRLRAVGAGPERVVAVSTERRPEMIQAVLATFAAGAAFVPVDPALPAARRRLLLQESGAVAAIIPRGGAPLLPVDAAEEEPLTVVPLEADLAADAMGAVPWAPVPVAAHQLAYVLYTSGSTGRPKGVLVSHGALAAHTADAVASYRVTAADRLLNFASLSFDASAEEIWPALTTGARLVLRTDATLATPADLAQACGNLGITVLNLPTAYWHTFTAAGDPLPYSVRLTIIGGEAAWPSAMATWRATQRPQIELYNTYGPTEATVVATRWLDDGSVADGDTTGDVTVPIGYPLQRTRAYVLDRDLEPLPPGLPGDIYLGGAGLARGYLGHPARTADAFRPDPHVSMAGAAGERLYRTGDLGRFRDDGRLDCLGRRDGQVKVRGYRVELGEIEAALLRQSVVAEAVAGVRAASDAAAADPSPAAGARVVAWVVLKPSATALNSGGLDTGDLGTRDLGTVDDLRQALAQELPPYMVPAAIVLLPRLPLTTAGKVDRRALPEPERGDLAGTAEMVAPRDETEEQLAALVLELLELMEISVFDSFFDLGGHSLLATRYLARVREIFAVDLPLRTLFEAPTVAALALAVEEAIFRELAAEEGLDVDLLGAFGGDEDPSL